MLTSSTNMYLNFIAFNISYDLHVQQNLCMVIPSIINAAKLVGASDNNDLILSASISVDFCSSNCLFNSINSSFNFIILPSASFFLVHDDLVFNLSVVASNFLFLAVILF